MEWDWIKGLMLALPTLASAVTAWAVLTGRGKTPQPLVVRGDTRVATWEELAVVSKRIDDMDEDLQSIRESIAQSERRTLEEASRRAGKLHARIDDVEKDIGRVPARTIAMLKETKGLLQ